MFQFPLETSKKREHGAACAQACTCALLESAAALGMSSSPQYVDIGANLCDDMFVGVYNGSQKHEADLVQVIDRARSAGVANIIVTAGNLDEARQCLQVVKGHEGLATTVGVHPTRCDAFKTYEGGEEEYFAALLAVAEEGKRLGKVVAIGECGLDWDRTRAYTAGRLCYCRDVTAFQRITVSRICTATVHVYGSDFCSKEVQLPYFEKQFALAESTGLPMFLHSRSCQAEFYGVWAIAASSTDIFRVPQSIADRSHGRCPRRRRSKKPAPHAPRRRRALLHRHRGRDARAGGPGSIHRCVYMGGVHSRSCALETMVFARPLTRLLTRQLNSEWLCGDTCGGPPQVSMAVR